MSRAMRREFLRSTADYVDAHRREHRADRLTYRLERLGYRVRLEPVPTVEGLFSR
jgi:hypothetical protein